MIGESRAMEPVLERSLASVPRANVFITGENGTGKGGRAVTACYF
jgi:DNA-binding NtrC family response regulator